MSKEEAKNQLEVLDTLLGGDAPIECKIGWRQERNELEGFIDHYDDIEEVK